MLYEIYTYDFHNTHWGVSLKHPPRWVRDRKKYPIMDLSEYKESAAKKFLFITCQRKISRSNLPILIERHKLYRVIQECYDKGIIVILDGSFETLPKTERYVLNETLFALRPHINSKYFRILINSGEIETIVEGRYRKLFRNHVPHIHNMVTYMNEMGHEWPYNVREEWSKKYNKKTHKFSTHVSSFSKFYRSEVVGKIMQRKLDFFITGHPITWNLWHKERTKDEFIEFAETLEDEKFKTYYLKNLDKILDIKLYFKGKEISNPDYFDLVDKTADFDPEIVGGPNSFRDSMSIYNMCDHVYNTKLFLALESNEWNGFLTEKSIRPMLMGLPFITLPTHKAKRYKFATYDKIFDYSFESEPTISKRIDNVLDQFEVLQKDKGLDKLIEESKDVIEYNRQRVMMLHENTDNLFDQIYHMRATGPDPKKK